MKVAVGERTYGVASGHPLAAQVGLDALRAGGSAVDAVLAAAIAQWVVNGPLCGPGGDLFVLSVPGDGSVPVVYGGWSRIPLSFPASGPIQSTGPCAAVVPGSLAGVDAAAVGAGRLPWAELFDGALRLADGHPVTPWMERSYRGVIDRGHGSALASFLDQRGAPRAGEIVSCSRFAKTLQSVARGGVQEFYRGELSQRILAASSASGGYLRSTDFELMAAEVAPAEVHELGDIMVALPPKPSQAGIVAELMAAAPAWLPPTSFAYAEATAAVVERALTDRCIAGIPGTAATVATDGVDMAAVVHSLAGVQFGSGWVAGDTGIALGNRVGTGLTTRADLPAAQPVPGAVLTHTLSAAVFRSAHRVAVVATPGGDRQVQWLAQAGQRFRRGEPLKAIASGPRWFVCPEGDRFGVPGGLGSEWFLFCEPGVDWFDERALAGYRVRGMESVGGGIQAVECSETGWRVASDPRAGGEAIAERGSHRV
jgi:gamma-glutamyltranspeptidase/glutathione hydrolase